MEMTKVFAKTKRKEINPGKKNASQENNYSAHKNLLMIYKFDKHDVT